MKRLILAVNPGTTTTKISVYLDKEPVFVSKIEHTREELDEFPEIVDQYKYRVEKVLDALHRCQEYEWNQIDAVVGRGGILKPIQSGVYEVNQQMREDLITNKYGEHACNFGALIAEELKNKVIAAGGKCKAFIADPVVINEMEDIAKISGSPLIERTPIFHALNQKAIARQYARQFNKRYEDVNLVVAHIGGGISVGVHRKGKIIDVNNAFNGDGPFSPERTGGLPSMAIVDLCFSGKYTYDQMKKNITGNGGCIAYLGTNSFIEIDKMIEEGNEKAILIADAFVYQIAKEIGAASTVLFGNVDAILLTGGVANDSMLMKKLSDRINFIAPVMIYPGEDEMGALAENALEALNGNMEIKQY